MPVALCVFGIWSVLRAIHKSANTPHSPNDHRNNSNNSQVAVTLGCEAIWAARPVPTTTACATTASVDAVRSVRSGASSIPGALRYQWPRSMDANTSPSTKPEVTTLSDDHHGACEVVLTVGLTITAAAIEQAAKSQSISLPKPFASYSHAAAPM